MSIWFHTEAQKISCNYLMVFEIWGSGYLPICHKNKTSKIGHSEVNKCVYLKAFIAYFYIIVYRGPIIDLCAQVSLRDAFKMYVFENANF